MNEFASGFTPFYRTPALMSINPWQGVVATYIRADPFGRIYELQSTHGQTVYVSEGVAMISTPQLLASAN